MKKACIVLALLMAATLMVYGQTQTASASNNSLDPSQQMSTFKDAVQKATDFYNTTNQKLGADGGNQTALANQRTYESYQSRLSTMQKSVEAKQKYLESLVDQKAPLVNINQARQDAMNALSGYHTTLQQFTAWVASLDTSKNSASGGNS
ncbi:MAG: hypothetical protein LBM77_11945 [Spirochaetaceae bacterium]|jgi:hypothetical protein|nr:hypothetical protein [Spirochaetaceae bacterium]